MIFVTGAAGFIGSNFVHFLTENVDEEIVIIDKITYAGSVVNLYPLSQHKIERVDICNFDELKTLFKNHRPRAVFHFAAESHVDNSIKDVSPFVYTNVIGTTNLLRCAVDHDVEMFHHISTDEVYGSLDYDDPSFTEETSYDPQNPYSASKAASDHFVMAFHNTFGLPVKITNCSNNYGPRQNIEKLIPKTITNILRGNKIPVYGKGENASKNKETYMECENDWCERSRAIGLPPFVVRNMFWDKIKEQKSLRFWSYVFEPHGDQIPVDVVDGIDFGEPLELLKV